MSMRATRGKFNVAALFVIVAIAFIFPFLSSPYRVFQLSLVGVYMVALIGLCVVTGTAGQITLGHSFFFAVGAYVGSGLITHIGVPELLTVPIAAIICFALGWLFGVPALRLRGLYLAIITLSIAIAAPPLAREFSDFTGGVAGTNIGPGEPPSGFASDQWIYLVVLLVTIVCMLLGYALLRGPFGRSMRAVRDNETAAAACGINVSRVKVQAFAIASMFGGAAGALYTIVVRYVAPGSFTLVLSIMMLAALVVGGMRSLFGVFLGAVFLQYVPALAGDINVALSGVTFGVLLILLVIFLPQGASGLLEALWSKLKTVNTSHRRKQSDAAEMPEAARSEATKPAVDSVPQNESPKVL